MAIESCISEADLGRLSDNEVTSSEREAMEQHLEACRDCTARWDLVSAGEQRLRMMLRSFRYTERTGCLPDDVIVAYLSGTLDAEQSRNVEAHLRDCGRCGQKHDEARQLVESYGHEGGQWWARFAGEQVLRLVARVPAEAEALVSKFQAETKKASCSNDVIKFPLLAPASDRVQRLAAATGEGFIEQTLQQEDPPFEFHLVLFGEELRVSARTLDEESPYRQCLARLQLIEGTSIRCSRIVLIDGGEGTCVYTPDEVRASRPEFEALSVQIQPLVTIEDLAEAGADAYTPILARLLMHEDASIRIHAIEVMSRIGGPDEASLIEPLTTDPEQSIREAAAKALRQLRLD